MSSSIVGYTIYALIAAAWVAWGVFARLQRPRFATFGGIMARMMRNPILRWAVWASWSFVGWHLFVRGSGAFK